MIRALLLGTALSAAFCNRSSATAVPKPTPAVVAGAGAACANLADLACELGTNPQCVQIVEMAIDENHTSAAVVACVAAAKTPAAVNDCGPYFACP